MQHVMLDLETWGTKPGCALRSIGAVAFELDGAIGDEFYRNIDDASCVAAGLQWDRSTMDWWEQQSVEAKESLIKDQHHLGMVVFDFHKWFTLQHAVHVWSHGGNFDEPIWVAAAHAAGYRVPWKFWNARCTRTAYALAGFDPRSIEREGTYHNALDDARYQARCVQAAYRKLGTKAVEEITSGLAQSSQRSSPKAESPQP